MYFIKDCKFFFAFCKLFVHSVLGYWLNCATSGFDASQAPPFPVVSHVARRISTSINPSVVLSGSWPSSVPKCHLMESLTLAMMSSSVWLYAMRFI